MKDVSFIIPNYNGEKTIERVIESILKQDYKKGKKEIIILDDKSKDNSVKKISKYKSKVKLIINKKNIGEVGSTNRGLKIAKYEIICIILCDYILESKNWLTRMIKAINSNPKIGMVGTNVILPRNLWESYKFWDRVVLSPVFDKESKGDIKKGKPVMYKKEVFDRLGLYDESYKMGADTDMRLKILISALLFLILPLSFVVFKGLETSNQVSKEGLNRQFTKESTKSATVEAPRKEEAKEEVKGASDPKVETPVTVSGENQPTIK